MAKDGPKKDPSERARRKLTKAQMELSVAEEEHAQARVRGKQEIEQARLRAAKWLTKTGKRVDRRVAAVSKAEDRLTALLVSADELAPVIEQIIDVADAESGASRSPLRGREQQALDALGSLDSATSTEWQAAAKMSEATFLRARKELMDRRLVVREGDGHRGGRYRLQGPAQE